MIEIFQIQSVKNCYVSQQKNNEDCLSLTRKTQTSGTEEDARLKPYQAESYDQITQARDQEECYEPNPKKNQLFWSR